MRSGACGEHQGSVVRAGGDRGRESHTNLARRRSRRDCIGSSAVVVGDGIVARCGSRREVDVDVAGVGRRHILHRTRSSFDLRPEIQLRRARRKHPGSHNAIARQRNRLRRSGGGVDQSQSACPRPGLGWRKGHIDIAVTAVYIAWRGCRGQVIPRAVGLRDSEIAAADRAVHHKRCIPGVEHIESLGGARRSNRLIGEDRVARLELQQLRRCGTLTDKTDGDKRGTAGLGVSESSRLCGCHRWREVH